MLNGVPPQTHLLEAFRTDTAPAVWGQVSRLLSGPDAYGGRCSEVIDWATSSHIAVFGMEVWLPTTPEPAARLGILGLVA